MKEKYIEMLISLLEDGIVSAQFEDVTDNQGYEEVHALTFPDGTSWYGEYSHMTSAYNEEATFNRQLAGSALQTALLCGQYRELCNSIDHAQTQRKVFSR